MHQVWITRRGAPTVLKARAAPDPTPGSGEVRVRVAYAGVNFADVMIRMGLYPDAPPLPLVPGYEVSGTVDAVGEGVADRWLGREVAAVMSSGGYADVACVSLDGLFALPDGVSLQAAAALPVNGLTAWQMLGVMAPPRRGDVVLVHGAAGGVGSLAVQLALRAGARVLGSASPVKHAWLREQGVDVCLDSRRTRFSGLVRDLTGGRGADIVLEPRHGRWIGESYRCLAPTGRLVLFGFASAVRGLRGSPWSALWTLARVPWLRINPVTLMNDNRGIMGVNLGRMWHDTQRLRAWMEILMKQLAAGELTPRIDTVLSLARAAEAHRRLQERRNRGKILLRTAAAGEATP